MTHGRNSLRHIQVQVLQDREIMVAMERKVEEMGEMGETLRDMIE